MKVLVTGGAGFIGSHTVDALLARGHDVRVLDSLEPPVHRFDAPRYLPPDVEFIRGSVTDPTAFRGALDGVEAVFHFAAYQDYLTDFSRFFHINSAGTALLYELIVRDHLPVRKVVVASSQAVYGEGRYHCDRHGDVYPDPRAEAQLDAGAWSVCCPACGGDGPPPVPMPTDESHAAPHNSYGLSKRDQEEIAMKLGRRYGIPSVALRYSIVQGPRQSFHNAYSGALRSFTVRVLHGKPPVVYEDGEQLRDYVSVHDVVRANLLTLEDGRADYGVFNVGGDRRVTVRHLAAMVAQAAARDVGVAIHGNYRVGDSRHIFSDVSRLRALGWAPTASQQAIVEEYVAWAAEHPELRDTYAEARSHMAAMGVLRGGPRG